MPDLSAIFHLGTCRFHPGTGPGVATPLFQKHFRGPPQSLNESENGSKVNTSNNPYAVRLNVFKNQYKGIRMK